MPVQVSRADVPSTEIQDLQSDTRFIKLPVSPYLELLGIDPLPSQIALINVLITQNIALYRPPCLDDRVRLILQIL